jgi:predicted metal-dependent hydrolase
MTVGSIDIEIVRKNIKNIHLAVYPPHGHVRLASPMNIKEETIRLFAASKLGWIRRQQRKYAGYERQSPRQYVSRETHYFLGRPFLLRIVETEVAQKVLLSGHRHIEMHIRKNTTEEKCAELMNEWYRTELKKIVPDLIRKWELRIGVNAQAWGVKLMKTKWGTCNTEGKRIWLNLELAKKPVNCLEYIICHELVHLLERKHNDVFMAYMDRFMPKWRIYRNELNSLPVQHEEWGY